MFSLIQDNHDQIVSLCKQYGVFRLELFGSAADGTFGPESDIDFLIEFNRSSGANAFDQYFGLLLALKQLLGHEVDLIEPATVTNPYMLNAIRRAEKQVVYDAA